MKNTVFCRIYRMFSRRKWLLLLIFLPLFIPMQTARPYYKVLVRIRLNPPAHKEAHTERMHWLAEQVDILEDKKLLADALRRSDFSEVEVNKYLPLIENNLNATIIGNDTLEIELVTPEKDRLKSLANEIATIYFDTAEKRKEAEQTKIYESAKEEFKSLDAQLIEAKAVFDAARIALEKSQMAKTADDTQQLKDQINGLKGRLSEMRTIYTEEHPQVKELIEQIFQKIQVLNDKQIKLSEEQKTEAILTNDYLQKEKSFNKLTEKYDLLKTEMASPQQQEIGNIVDIPEIVSIGTAKAKLFDVLGKLLFGIATAFLVGFITKSLDEAVWSEDEIKRDVGIRTLGTIIKLKKQPPSGLLTDCPKNSAIVKSFETFRSNIQFINLATPLKSILYCSLLKEEDLLAGNLAISMTFIGGKVGLINASNISQRYNHLLTSANNKNPKDAQEPFSFKDTVIKNLKILNIGSTDAIEKQQVSDLLVEQKEKFDAIIIDSPSIAESVFAATLASVVDGVILGAKARITEREALLRNYKISTEINTRILGVVLQW